MTATAVITPNMATVWMPTAVACAMMVPADGAAPMNMYSEWGISRASMVSDATAPPGRLNSRGSSMSPAPCADAMRNDHEVRSRKPTRIPTQRGCEFRQSLYTP